MRVGLCLGVLVLILLPLVARAEGDCDSKGQLAVGIVQVTGGTAEATAYLDDRNYVTGNGLWMYIETNGMWTPKAPGVYFGDPDHADLQRGPSGCEPMFETCVVEICADFNDISPDIVVF